MIDIRQLSVIPELGLKLMTDHLGDWNVNSVHLLSDADWIGQDTKDALIVTAQGFLSEYERLFQTLAAGRSAGIVVCCAPTDNDMRPLHMAAARYGLPLLTSTRTLRQWRMSLTEQVSQMCVDAARRHGARLSRLLEQFRVPAPNIPTGIAGLISEELQGEVVIMARGETLASAPPTAAITLAPVLQDPGRRHQTTPTGLFARVEPMASIPDGFIAVALREPFTRSANELICHASHALGVALSPARENSAADFTHALTQIRLAAFQMLMTGHVLDAQRVMASVSPGLLDREEAQVVIVDCGAAPRDAVMAEMEKNLDGAGLPVRCPAYPQHIITVIPVNPENPYGPETNVRQLLETFKPHQVSAGGSLPYPLPAVSSAYVEALDALRAAAHRAERMVVATTSALSLAEILPADQARAWASTLLEPILTTPGAHDILRSVAMALEFKTTAAARIMGMHRNTLHRRVAKVFEDISCSHDRTFDRIILSLALQIIDTHGPDLSRRHTVTLHDVLTAPPVSVWADKFIRPLTTDDRGLLRALRAWVAAEFDEEAAGAQLCISGGSVRWKIQTAEPLMEKDLITVWPPQREDPGEQRLSGIRPLTVALYATTPPGATPPPLPDPTNLTAARGTLAF